MQISKVNSFNTAFKGQSEIRKKTNWGKPASDKPIEITAEDVSRPFSIVTEGKAGYISQTKEDASCRVYYADPDEKITNDIKKSNKYIVQWEDRTQPVTMKDIKKAKTIEELNGLLIASKPHRSLYHARRNYYERLLEPIEQIKDKNTYALKWRIKDYQQNPTPENKQKVEELKASLDPEGELIKTYNDLFKKACDNATIYSDDKLLERAIKEKIAELSQE